MEINEEELRTMDPAGIEKELCIIKGVGNKVANCVMLFSLGKRDSFPIDVWMKRVLEQVYFNGEDKSKEYLLSFSKDKFGNIGRICPAISICICKRYKVGVMI